MLKVRIKRVLNENRNIGERLTGIVGSAAGSESDRTDSKNIEIMKKLGFAKFLPIGRGEKGRVYKAEWVERDGVEHAVKIVDRYEAVRELNNYRVIGNARAQSESIAKHFPRVDFTGTDPESGKGVIVMELLEVDPAAQQVISDVFANAEALVGRDYTMKDRMGTKVPDLSKRLTVLLGEPKGKSKLFSWITYGLTNKFDLSMVSKNVVGADYRNMSKVNDKLKTKVKHLTYQLLPDGEAQYMLDVIEEDFEAGAPAVLNFVYIYIASLWNAYKEGSEIMKSFQADKEQSGYTNEEEAALEAFEGNLASSLGEFIEAYRQWSPVGVTPDAGDVRITGAPEDLEGLNYPGAKSILKALKELNSITGLIPKDMHNDNAMIRPGTKDIVIMDVGLFGRASRRKAPKMRQPTTAKLATGEDPFASLTGAPRGGNTFKIHEVESEKQRRWACAQMDKSVEDRPKGLSKTESEEMCKSSVKETKMNNFNEVWKGYLAEIEFDTSNLIVKDDLHEKFWRKSKLKSDIRKKLLEIARDFAEGVEIKNKIKDITLTGSIAAYNWHKKSDVDLHILVDFQEFIQDDVEATKEILTLKRIQWNRNHKIMIRGHEVEIYIQDINIPHHANGVYSVQDRSWLKKPEKTNTKLNLDQVLKKSEAIAEEIADISNCFLTKRYEEAHKYSIKLKDKIKKLRSAGLEKDGIYSIENMTFKVLRNNGYLQQLSTLKLLSYDKIMSLNDGRPIKVNINKIFSDYLNSF